MELEWLQKISYLRNTKKLSCNLINSVIVEHCMKSALIGLLQIVMLGASMLNLRDHWVRQRVLTQYLNLQLLSLLLTCQNHCGRKVTGSGKACAGVISTRTTYNLLNSEPYSWLSMYKSETNEDSPGTALKGISAMHGKKLPIADENNRNTYYQPQPSTSRRESSIFITLDREKKHLMPQIGLKLEHAYARSLACFATKFGPIGWAIAAKKIERVLPQGTRYGRGWIGANEAPNCYQPSILSSSPKVSSQ